MKEWNSEIPNEFNWEGRVHKTGIKRMSFTSIAIIERGIYLLKRDEKARK